MLILVELSLKITAHDQRTAALARVLRGRSRVNSSTHTGRARGSGGDPLGQLVHSLLDTSGLAVILESTIVELYSVSHTPYPLVSVT